MKKVMLKYLDYRYPNTFIKKTIFGSVACYNDDSINTYSLSKELIKWFDVDMKYAKDIVEIWYSKLPVVISLRSSTNPAVLVTETTTVNSTL
jgi:hypothetical protein